MPYWKTGKQAHLYGIRDGRKTSFGRTGNCRRADRWNVDLENRSISFDEQGRGHLLSKISLPITGTPADTLYAAYADEGFNTYTFSTPIVIDTGDTAAIQAAKPIAITGKLTVYGDIVLDHGSVSINRSEGGILPDAPTVLAGDLRGEGSARVGLGKYSAWRGAAIQKGSLDLTMEEAIWENAAQKAAERGSRVERLQASENTLIWQKDSKPLTIDRFSGSLLLRYDHEAGAPTVFLPAIRSSARQIRRLVLPWLLIMEGSIPTMKLGCMMC